MCYDSDRGFGAAASVQVYRCMKSCSRESLTFVIQQHVLWFQVSVDDPVLVQVLQPADDLSCVETRSLLIETRILFIHIIHVKPVEQKCSTLCYFLK